MKSFVKMLARITERTFKWFYWCVLDLSYAAGVLSFRNIPIVINNFNRLTMTVKLVKFLEAAGYRNIIILDNHSTYPPLLDYYATCKATVIRANENFGHLALWHSKLYHRLKWNYFVYTDSDVLPVEACPPDFISYLQSQVRWRWQLDKVGFGIVIDDLPEAFSLKEKVVAYESRYWQKQIKPGIYDAPIDTTLALYRPFSNLNQGHSFTMCSWRTGRPYVLRHLPWYVDSANLDQEEKFYRAHANQSSSLVKQESGQEKIY